MMPHDLPPWHTVYQQAQRWLKAGVFEAIVHDLRMLLRDLEGRMPHPRAAVLDIRMLQSSPESGGRAGYDGHKRRKGSKTHMAVDTLGRLVALVVTPADEQARARIGELAEAVQEATSENMEVGYVDQGYAGEQPAERGIRLEVVKLPEAKRGFVLLPRRWAAERSFAWLAHFHRLARDYERLPETLARLHLLAFAGLMLKRFVTLMAQYA